MVGCSYKDILKVLKRFDEDKKSYGSLKHLFSVVHYGAPEGPNLCSIYSYKGGIKALTGWLFNFSEVHRINKNIAASLKILVI